MAMTTSTEVYFIPTLMFQLFNRFDKTWTPENPSAALPRVDLNSTNQNGNSTLYLIKSDYVSLQDITLSYQLPQDFTQQIGLSALKIYLTGNNLYFMVQKKRL